MRSGTAAEDLFAVQLDRRGIEYDRQVEYALGRKFRADFALDSNILVEIVGGVWQRRAHGSVSGILRDIERLNAATLAGYRMLRFTPDQVDDGSALETVVLAGGLSKRDEVLR